MNVAQLKLLETIERACKDSRFHVRMNVAQLKHSRLRVLCLRHLWFPRSNERGSIEAAASHVPCLRAPRCFHVRMNVAQLKPARTRRAERSLSAFPRSNERGSIEALYSRAQPADESAVSTFE